MFKKLINKIKDLFLENDWQVLWEEKGIWEGSVRRYCTYKIKASKVRKAVVLDMSGHRPEHHPVRRIAEVQYILHSKKKDLFK